MKGRGILAEGLEKRFGETRALAGLDLEADEGDVLGLLGPNGAGKTTAVRILTTLLRPDAGHATVAGLDVVRDAAALRQQIGLAGQYAAVDEYLTGRENLEMFGRLYRMPRARARQRADDLLERFDLSGAAARAVKGYSGGMRRRLDLAAALVAAPPVLFLDEPTTGLDPRGRLAMWDLIGELASGGVTVLLTTQYLEEADRLADQIAVVDQGRVIAEGTADQLKAQVGGEWLEATVAAAADVDAAVSVLARYGDGDPRIDRERRHVAVPIHGGAARLAEIGRDVHDAAIELLDFGIRRPTLDDVFLTLTGHAADDQSDGERAGEEVAA